MTTKRPIDVRLNPIYTSIISVLNMTTKRPIDVRLNPIYTSINVTLGCPQYIHQLSVC